MNRGILTSLFLLLALLPGCTGIPEGIRAVENIDTERYLGKWYEIARLDHSFERGMNRVTAQYSLRDDGGIRVINRGYKEKKKEWSEAEGRAYFIGEKGSGRLKVSFFGPFYGGYNIIELDMANYSYAMICGYNMDYLWILARTPELDKQTRDELLQKAKNLGFAVEKLIFPEQGP